MRWLARLRARPEPEQEAVAPSACPACGEAVRSVDPVCRTCGLPLARLGDPLYGAAPRWHETPDGRPSSSASLFGIVLVLGLLLFAGTLATSGAGVLQYGGRLGMTPAPSPDAVEVAQPEVAVVRPAVASPMVQTSPEPFAWPEDDPVETCEEADIDARTQSRWRVESVYAGRRKGSERVTIQLARSGKAKSAARITVEEMSPTDARRMFGLPRFQGQHGLLLTYRGPVSAGQTRLIGSVDLTRVRMRSISGIYHFTDTDGRARTFVALRDDFCASVRGPGFADRSGGADRPRLLIDVPRG